MMIQNTHPCTEQFVPWHARPEGNKFPSMDQDPDFSPSAKAAFKRVEAFHASVRAWNQRVEKLLQEKPPFAQDF
jgi:hypothetical protein